MRLRRSHVAWLMMSTTDEPSVIAIHAYERRASYCFHLFATDAPPRDWDNCRSLSCPELPVGAAMRAGINAERLDHSAERQRVAAGSKSEPRIANAHIQRVGARIARAAFSASHAAAHSAVAMLTMPVIQMSIKFFLQDLLSRTLIRRICSAVNF